MSLSNQTKAELDLITSHVSLLILFTRVWFSCVLSSFCSLKLLKYDEHFHIIIIILIPEHAGQRSKCLSAEVEGRHAACEPVCVH